MIDGVGSMGISERLILMPCPGSWWLCHAAVVNWPKASSSCSLNRKGTQVWGIRGYRNHNMWTFWVSGASYGRHLLDEADGEEPESAGA